MEKKLYYTVDKELVDVDGISETTGWKDINVYDIVENEPVLLVTITCENHTDSIEMIRNELTNPDTMKENVFTDEDSESVKLIQIY